MASAAGGPLGAMATKSKKRAQAQRRATRRRAVEKLQSVGLLGKVDLRKRPSKGERAKVIKYRDLISGRAQVVKAPNKRAASQLRGKFGLKGADRVLVVPREKGEKFRLTKEGELKSTRQAFGQTVHKTIGEKFSPTFKRPANAKAYYTIPSRVRGTGKLKRKTFANFDELLYYLMSYDIGFEDIEDRIEIEEFEQGSPHEKAMAEKISRERAQAIKRAKRRKARAGKKKTRGKRSR